jgi:hypothetical protein
LLFAGNYGAFKSKKASNAYFEAIQFVFAIGRADTTDLLGNTLGVFWFVALLLRNGHWIIIR